MGFVVTLPYQLVEETCPSGDFLHSGDTIESLTAVISTAFNLTTWLHRLETAGCHFVYMSMEDHPFKIVGECFELWQMKPTDAPVGEVEDGHGYRLNLPFSDEAIDQLKEEAAWYGLAADQPELVVPAMMNLLAAMQAYDKSVDGRMIKPAIRGTQEAIDLLQQQGSLEGFGGILDTDATLGSNEVWGLQEDDDGTRPTFVLFD